MLKLQKVGGEFNGAILIVPVVICIAIVDGSSDVHRLILHHHIFHMIQSK